MEATSLWSHTPLARRLSESLANTAELWAKGFPFGRTGITKARGGAPDTTVTLAPKHRCGTPCLTPGDVPHTLHQASYDIFQSTRQCWREVSEPTAPNCSCCPTPEPTTQ